MQFIFTMWCYRILEIRMDVQEIMIKMCVMMCYLW